MCACAYADMRVKELFPWHGELIDLSLRYLHASCLLQPYPFRPDERAIGSLLQRRLLKTSKPTEHRQIGYDALIEKMKSKKCLVGITVTDMGLLESLTGAVLNSVRGDVNSTRGSGGAKERKRCLVLVLDEAAPMIDDPASGWLPLARNGNGVVVMLGDNRGLNADEEEGLAGLELEGIVQVVKVSLGSIPLLASQCIVLVNHYLGKHSPSGLRCPSVIASCMPASPALSVH